MIKDLIESYFKVSDELEILENKKRELTKKYEELKEQIITIMTSVGMLSVKTNIGGVRLGKPRVFASVSKENKERLWNWIIENKLERAILSPHHASLSAEISRRLEDGDAIPEFVNVYTASVLYKFSQQEKNYETINQ